MVEPFVLAVCSYSGCCIHSLNIAWHANSLLDRLILRPLSSFPLVAVTVLLGEAQGVRLLTYLRHLREIAEGGK